MIAVLVLATACGGTQLGTGASSTARVATSTQPPAQAQAPIVVAFRDGKASMTIDLVDASGRVGASTMFVPPALPAYAYCATILQPPVRVAAGAVYFADSTGQVKKLAVDGSVTPVAKFELSNPQQALSFAVSPDGAQLIAIILSTPPLHSPPPQKLGDPLFAAGTWSLDLETAPAGGATTLQLHKDLGTALPPSPTVITGWDALGPTATLGSAICTQNVVPSLRYTGTLVRLGTDGTHLERIGGSTCTAWDELVDGTVVCGENWQSFTVRRRNGDVLWSGGGDFMQDVMLSPDGSAVASAEGVVYLRDPVETASYARKAEPQARIIGWASRDAVVVLRNDGHVGVAPPTHPNMFSDLGLVVARSCATCGLYEARAFGTVQRA